MRSQRCLTLKTDILFGMLLVGFLALLVLFKNHLMTLYSIYVVAQFALFLLLIPLAFYMRTNRHSKHCPYDLKSEEIDGRCQADK